MIVVVDFVVLGVIFLKRLTANADGGFNVRNVFVDCHFEIDESVSTYDQQLWSVPRCTEMVDDFESRR